MLVTEFSATATKSIVNVFTTYAFVEKASVNRFVVAVLERT